MSSEVKGMQNGNAAGARPAKADSALVKTYSTYPFVLESAQGEILRDEQGREYTDFYGGHCVCGTGHGHPRVRAAITAQLERLMFYSNAAQIRIREQAAARLVQYAGSGMAAAFFCNSGSEANENALKVAVKHTGRSRFVAFGGSFHGRSLLALSVTDDPKIRDPYAALLAPTYLLPLNDSQALAHADFSDCAAVILEPVQSMAGVRMAEREWLRALREKCSQSGTLLIFDEVQTGFGRLGTPFAAQFYGIEPDMLSCAKGIASGFPMGALLLNGALAAGIQPGDLGSTFGGGPLACAALLATLDVIEDEGLAARASAAELYLREALAAEDWLQLSGAGLLLGLHAGAQAAALKKHLQAQGLLVGGSNDPAVLRLLPPLNISDTALQHLVAEIRSFGQSISHKAERETSRE